MQGFDEFKIKKVFVDSWKCQGFDEPYVIKIWLNFLRLINLNQWHSARLDWNILFQRRAKKGINAPEQIFVPQWKLAECNSKVFQLLDSVAVTLALQPIH